MITDEKLTALKNTLTDMDSVLVAYSGGVDSTLLLWAALDALGPEKVLTVTAASPVYPHREIEEAQELARALGTPHRIVPACQMEDEQFLQNPPRRCYYCKLGILQQLVALAQEEGKAARRGEAAINATPEYRDCQRIAAERGIPIKDVYREAVEAMSDYQEREGA